MLVGDYGWNFAGGSVTGEFDGPVSDDGDVGFVWWVFGMDDCICGSGVPIVVLSVVVHAQR